MHDREAKLLMEGDSVPSSRASRNMRSMPLKWERNLLKKEVYESVCRRWWKELGFDASRKNFCLQRPPRPPLSAEAIRLGNFTRRRSVRGSRMVIMQQLRQLVPHLFATRRHYLLDQKLLKIMGQARP